MRFLTHRALTPLLTFIDDDRDMTEPLAHPRSAALGARRKPFPHARFVNFCLLDKQTIDIDTLGILGIGNRGAHRLRNNTRGPFGDEFENIQRLLDAFAANLIYHQAHLSGRDSDKFCDRACFHTTRLIYSLYAFGAAAGAAAGRGAAVGAAVGAPVVSFASALRSPECA